MGECKHFTAHNIALQCYSPLRVRYGVVCMDSIHTNNPYLTFKGELWDACPQWSRENLQCYMPLCHINLKYHSMIYISYKCFAACWTGHINLEFYSMMYVSYKCFAACWTEVLQHVELVCYINLKLSSVFLAWLWPRVLFALFAQSTYITVHCGHNGIQHRTNTNPLRPGNVNTYQKFSKTLS